ncbi:hypothetical protein EDD90_7414 [Streptomyces sp. Ag109_O5-1]|uniref:hypothetical protein n=1 Tax=Streptomyces sp. Ag109_O5-1 TaxID=1938851 RepID=UPI000F4D39CB|nr:hypothetical protein [Streptomyces sp. Ag109_O5-1]RPE44184.1 hypothetical protein EDD90_7414 [Streptomyces sp. Ag109_O5-1]
MKQISAATKELMASARGDGYRAAGLCASRHSSGALCTRSAKDRHGSGKHSNPYQRRWPGDAVGLRW